MLRNEYALVLLLNSVSKIVGRKRLQKVVYLLQQTGVPFTEKFSYHHYGPYSSELQAEIDRLVDYQLVSETCNNACYTYEITEEGIKFLETYQKVVGEKFSLPQEIVMRLMNTNTQVLEMASTYAYLLEMGYKQKEALAKALELKPHLKGFLSEAKMLFDEIRTKRDGS